MAKLLVIGATGLLGQAIVRIGRGLGHDVTGLARENADINLDVRDVNAFKAAVAAVNPDYVVNSAAIVNLGVCEADPCLAYMVNARPAGILADLANQSGFKNIYVSTDHYFVGDDNIVHDEHARVVLVNEYARTKYLGECLANMEGASLVLRTNIVGARWRKGMPTFTEWAIDALLRRTPLTLFNDVFTSPIHVDDFAIAMFRLIAKGAFGTINLAAREVSSKKQFIEALARQLNITLDWASTGSGECLSPQRANSLGLDVSRAECLLGYQLPGLDDTVEMVIRTHDGTRAT